MIFILCTERCGVTKSRLLGWLLLLTIGLGDVAAFENRQFVTAAKFITKSLLFILLLGFIRRLEPKLNSEQKVENIYSSPRHIAKPPVVC